MEINHSPEGERVTRAGSKGDLFFFFFAYIMFCHIFVGACATSYRRIPSNCTSLTLAPSPGLNMDMIRQAIKVEKSSQLIICSQFGKISKYDSLIKQLLLLIFAAVHTTGYGEKVIQEIKELVHSLTISTNLKILRILL